MKPQQPAGVRGWPRGLLFPLVLLLLLAPCASASSFKYFLKRSSGPVDSLCVQVGDVAQTPDNATALFIGSAKHLQGRGRRCSKPLVTYAIDSSFSVGALPQVIGNTSFNCSVWRAGNKDTVALTAENSVQDRPLTVSGTPTPLELSAPSSADPSPSVATADAQPVSAYNVSLEEELGEVEDYLSWYYSAYPDNRSLQGAIILGPDPNDADGTTWNSIYVLFQSQKNETVSGYLFSATFVLDPSAPAPPPPAGRRLLSLQGSVRRLMTYSYYGGSDGTKGKTCVLVCKVYSRNPLKYSCACQY